MDHRFECKSVKLLEENRGEHLHNLELNKEFLDMTPKHDPSKKNVINRTSSKLKMYALWKALLRERKEKVQNRRKYQ